LARVRQSICSRQNSLSNWAKSKGTRLDERVYKLASPDQATLPSLQLLPTLTASCPFSQFVAEIIRSNEKLFFITRSPPNQSWCKWKLVQLDFSSTMKLHPQCLQDGKFLVQFYMQHFNDESVNLTGK
jgi:hypothetical protein